jgi:hypothetical protein
MLKRVLKQGGADSGQIEAIEFNQYGGGKKTIEVGPSLMNLGDASGGLSLPGIGQSVWLYNNSTSTAFAIFYTQPGSVPSTPTLTTGIALSPNAYTKLSSGQFNSLKTSASTVGVYLVQDDSQLNNVAQ